MYNMACSTLQPPRLIVKCHCVNAVRLFSIFAIEHNRTTWPLLTEKPNDTEWLLRDPFQRFQDPLGLTYSKPDDRHATSYSRVSAKKNVTPLPTHWTYVFLALHRYMTTLIHWILDNTNPSLTKCKHVLDTIYFGDHIPLPKAGI